jgi:hypothetical protein
MAPLAPTQIDGMSQLLEKLQAIADALGITYGTDAGLIEQTEDGLAIRAIGVGANTSIPTKADVATLISAAITAIVDSAPDTLNTLNELAAALGDDANLAATLTAAIGTKYTLPETGIPDTDLSAALQAVITGKYTLPETGIPATDLAAELQAIIAAKYTLPEGGIPATDLAQALVDIIAAKYVKPETGIPAADLAQDVTDMVSGLIASLVDSAPETLNTLNELAAALGDDPNYATTIAAAIGAKYALPVGGIPATDIAQAVLDSISGKYAKPGTGIPATDLTEAVQASITAIAGKYVKPAEGIPATDLTAAAQALLTAAGSRTIIIKAIADATALAAGDGIATVVIPEELNGKNLVAVGAHVFTASSSGLPSVMIHNLTDAADMLTTAITIDATEVDSKDATTPAVIDASHDDVATGDVIRIDVDADGTDTTGLEIRLRFA